MEQELTEKAQLEQLAFSYLPKAESIKSAIKSVDSNAKKTKKLLGGYDKLLKTKTDELN